MKIILHKKSCQSAYCMCVYLHFLIVVWWFSFPLFWRINKKKVKAISIIVDGIASLRMNISFYKQNTFWNATNRNCDQVEQNYILAKCSPMPIYVLYLHSKLLPTNEEIPFYKTGAFSQWQVGTSRFCMKVLKVIFCCLNKCLMRTVLLSYCFAFFCMSSITVQWMMKINYQTCVVCVFCCVSWKTSLTNSVLRWK